MLILLGCRGMSSPFPPIHPNPNMDYQERYDPQEASAFFYDGMAMRQPVAGTVARGQLDVDHRLLFGRDDEGYFLDASPIPASDAVLARAETGTRSTASPATTSAAPARASSSSGRRRQRPRSTTSASPPTTTAACTT